MDKKYFKTEKVQAEFLELQHRIQFIVMSLAGFMLMEFDRHIVITSGYRKGKGGVHGDRRGCDVRCNDWSEEEIKAAEQYLKTVHYPGRFKTLLIHGKGDNIHFHIQISHREENITFIQAEIEALRKHLASDPEPVKDQEKK